MKKGDLMKSPFDNDKANETFHFYPKPSQRKRSVFKAHIHCGLFNFIFIYKNIAKKSASSKIQLTFCVLF